MKLDKILEFSVLKNSFYNSIVQDHTHRITIDCFPLIDRTFLQRYEMKMLSDDYKTELFNTLIRKTTSGSSGCPVNVYWNNSDYNKSMISLWRFRKKYYGISPTSKQINFIYNFFQLNHPITALEFYQQDNILSFNRSSFIGKESFDIFYKKAASFNPEWMYIQPFVLNEIVKYCIQNNCPPLKSLKYIECVGEMLTADIRKRAVDFFQVPLANMYGSEEMNGIAIECPFHTMHILEDNVYIECLHNNSLFKYGSGEIVLTNLNNYAMPLIRYMQGDMVHINEESFCKCGCRTKTLRVIEGRTQDAFYIKDTSIRVSSYMLTEAIHTINNLYGDPIFNYRFKYSKDTNQLLAFVVLSPTFKRWQETIRIALIKTFNNENLDKIQICINFVEELPINKSNKYKILEIE